LGEEVSKKILQKLGVRKTILDEKDMAHLLDVEDIIIHDNYPHSSLVEKLRKDWSCPKCNCPEHVNMIMCDLYETWYHWFCCLHTILLSVLWRIILNC